MSRDKIERVIQGDRLENKSYVTKQVEEEDDNMM